MLVPLFFSILGIGTVFVTTDEKYLWISVVLFALAGLIILYSEMMWLSWYWMVAALPMILRPFFYKESPIRKNKSIVSAEKNTFTRDWNDPMIVTNAVYLIASGITFSYEQFHLSFICVCNFWSSCVYHRERETAWYNYDCTFAQFQGFLLMWVMYCSAPSTSTMFSRIDAITYDGFTKCIESFFGVLSPFTDDRDFKSGLKTGATEVFTTCSANDEYFWMMFLCIPFGMLLLESGGENAIVIPVLDPGNQADTYGREKRESNLTHLGRIASRIGGMCYCARSVNPRYERYHPMWHLLSLAGPLLCTIYFNTHCEKPHVLGSNQMVTVPFLPFLETFQLPLVPTTLIAISLLNSVQLNLTGIKPPE